MRQLRLGTEVLTAFERQPAGTQIETERGVSAVRPELLGAEILQFSFGVLEHEGAVPATLHVKVGRHITELIREELSVHRRR